MNRTVATILLILLGTLMISNSFAETKSAARIQSEANLRQIAQWVFRYAQDNRNFTPGSIDQLEPYAKDANNQSVLEKVMTNPRTGAKPGYKLVQPQANFTKIRRPHEQPMFKELNPAGEIPEDSSIAFCDGHVESPRNAPTTKPATQPKE